MSVPAFTGSAHRTQMIREIKQWVTSFQRLSYSPSLRRAVKTFFMESHQPLRFVLVPSRTFAVNYGRTQHARVGTGLNSPSPPPPPPPLPPPSANSVRHNRLNSQVGIVKSTLVAMSGLPAVCFPASSGGGNRLCHGRAFQNGGGLGVLRVLSSSAGPAWP